MTIADRTWDDLPPEIHARIMAATAHASVRSIEKLADPEPGSGQGIWEVNAVAGDRFVHMTLGLRGDGSVSEDTHTFLTSEILEVACDSDRATVEVQGPGGRRSISIPASVGRAVDQRNESGLERSAKDLGRSIGGRIKQLAGEFLDDPVMEKAGRDQQVEADARRADDDEHGSSPT